MIKRTAFLLFLGVLIGAQPAMADEKADQAAIKLMLARIIPGQQPETIKPAPLPGMYEVVYGAQVMYVSKDGHYVMQGDLIDINSMQNLTENTRSVQRKKVIDAIPEDTMIVFEPTKSVKHTVTVFTDVDCGYCRKLHREINQYLDRGIRIRYVSFPRTGKFSESYYKAETVWCSKDRKTALTESKAGEKLEKKTCDNNPVDLHMAAADKVGVTGTPTIVLEDGEVIPGYVPAPRLAQMLDQ